MTEEEMNKPLVGIVSSYNEIVPGHMNLDKIVNAVKLGVAMAGGTPVVFPAIAVCDGIAMGHVGMKYSLVTRDLIADSTECMALAHQFDALVMVPNCDKKRTGTSDGSSPRGNPEVFLRGISYLCGCLHSSARSSLQRNTILLPLSILQKMILTTARNHTTTLMWSTVSEAVTPMFPVLSTAT